MAPLSPPPAAQERGDLPPPGGGENPCGKSLMTTSEAQCHVEEVAAAFGRGEIVVVADDDDRENEGDLFVAASMCTTEKMAFIIRHTSGLVCAPLLAEEGEDVAAALPGLPSSSPPPKG